MKRKKEHKVPEIVKWRGLGTIEIIIIIAVLIAVAMAFRTQLLSFADNLMEYVFQVEFDSPVG